MGKIAAFGKAIWRLGAFGWRRVSDLNTLLWIFPSGAAVVTAGLSLMQRLPLASLFVLTLAAFLIVLVGVILWQNNFGNARRIPQQVLDQANRAAAHAQIRQVKPFQPTVGELKEARREAASEHVSRKQTDEELPPTLYMRNTDAKSPHFPDKMFRIEWVENTLSLSFRGEGSDGISKAPILEPTLTFELLNAGDETVRHVVARWRLPDVDPHEDVALLGSNVRSFDGRQLKMQNEKGSASILTVSLTAESEPIPAIPSGGTAVLKAPTAFTTAYSIRALGRAKRQSDKHNPEQDTLKLLEQWGEPMDRAFVELSYAKSGQMCRHSFVIVGRVWGGSPPLDQSYDTRTGQVVLEHTPGITATIDHVGVLHNEG